MKNISTALRERLTVVSIAGVGGSDRGGGRGGRGVVSNGSAISNWCSRSLLHLQSLSVKEAHQRGGQDQVWALREVNESGASNSNKRVTFGVGSEARNGEEEDDNGDNSDDNAGDQFALHQKSKRGKLTGVLPYFLLRPDVVKAARHKVM